MKRQTLMLLALSGILSAGALYGSNLANPAMGLPPARLAVGASYHLGGYTITDQEVPAILNRFHVRCTYSPVKYVDFGVDLGATQMEVASFVDNIDTIGAFHGRYGFSGGAHLKLLSPSFLNDIAAIVGIVQATTFSSTNKHGARYGGFDGAGAAGVQVRIPRFGSITAGAKMYLIQGKNKSYKGVKGKYSNVNNIRGWLAIDFLPSLKADVKGKPYFSFELSLSPKANFTESVPVEEMSFSFSLGWILPRLYGEDFEDIE